LRYLGVDAGTRRIGLAISSPDSVVVSPVAVLKSRGRPGEDAKLILRSADEYAADGIVIGLPLNMDGTEGPQAKMSQTLADAIRKLAEAQHRQLEIHLHDERLTSHAADHRLLDRQLTRKKKKARQDAVAAQILLESFLETRE
jgi:putative Holliday junction resolvase